VNIKKRIFITSVLLCLFASASILPSGSSEPISKRLIVSHVERKHKLAQVAKQYDDEKKQYWIHCDAIYFLLARCLKKEGYITRETIMQCFHKSAAGFVESSDPTHARVEASLAKKIDKLEAASHEENNSF